MQQEASNDMPECTSNAADLTSVALPAIALTSLPSAKLSAFMVLEKLLADLSYATLAFRGYEWFESHLYQLSA